MLFVISRRNHPNVAYRKGQDKVLHLVSDLHEISNWADNSGRKWAFTDINAANRAADFFDSVRYLDKLNWEAIQSRHWKYCRDHKQAEFLLYENCPLHLIRDIGVYSQAMGVRVMAAMADSPHRPAVEVRPDWYY